MAGFTSIREQAVTEDKVRGKPELFADHYSQARLFWSSQSPAEQAHIVGGFRFELSKVQVPAIRERMLSMLANVDATLAHGVAAGLGMPVPPPQPLATTLPLPYYPPSPALSLLARRGEQGIKTRQVAILIAPGVDGGGVEAIRAALLADGAVPHLVAGTLNAVYTASGVMLAVEKTLENAPPVLFDAVAVPDGAAAAELLMKDALALDFVRQQYRHCKPLLVVGAGAGLLAKAGIPPKLPDGSPDPALIGTDPSDLPDALVAFKTALAGHRAFERETDPPLV
jgi:catalase